MELFHNDGHLTDDGLQATLNGSLNELECLEASEHLGFCSLCLDHYLTLLDTTPLMQPEAPIQKNVLRRIGHKAKGILFSRYATVAAAACLALAIWGGGLVPGLHEAGTGFPKAIQSAAHSAQERQAPDRSAQPSLATRISRATLALPYAMNDLFGLLSPLPKEPAANDGAPDEKDSSSSSSSSSSTASGAQKP